MAADQIDPQNLPTSFGALKPTGHVVVVLENDDTARRLSQALHEDGFASDDLVQVQSTEMAEQLKAALPDVTGTAGFGSEIGVMRRYQILAEGGCGWLLVAAGDHATEQRVAEMAKKFNARMATKYNMLTLEELV